MVRVQTLGGIVDPATGELDYSKTVEFLEEEVPRMDEDEVKRMVLKLIPVSSIRESLTGITGTKEPEITKREDGRLGAEVEFQLNCDSSNDAHFLHDNSHSLRFS